MPDLQLGILELTYVADDGYRFAMEILHLEDVERGTDRKNLAITSLRLTTDSDPGVQKRCAESRWKLGHSAQEY